MLKLIAVGLLSVAAGSMADAQPAVFINLGANSQANDVSADGTIVVGTHQIAGGSSPVYSWTAASGFEDIVPGTLSGNQPYVSTDGNVVAWNKGSTAYRWTSQSGPVSQTNFGGVQGLSGDGSTIVGTSSGGAVAWRQGNGVSVLPLPAGVTSGNTIANAVSYDGSTIVGSCIVPGTVPAMRWTSAGGVALGGIPGFPVDATATVVSADGNTIYGMAAGPGGYDTFRWTPATGVVGLGVGAGGFVLPNPIDMSADGQIIVGDAFGHAFVWRLGGGPRHLLDVLQGDYGLNLDGYQLAMARGISADGRTVVGWGYNSGGARIGWVVNLPWAVPAPGTASVLALAGLAVLRRRR